MQFQNIAAKFRAPEFGVLKSEVACRAAGSAAENLGFGQISLCAL